MANLTLFQVTVPGCKAPLQVVRFADGAIGATLRSLCAAILLSYAAQSHRLKRTPALNGSWRTAILKTAGGRKPVDVLYAWAIPLWAGGIQAGRLDAAKRDRILLIQREAVPAIYRAIWQAGAPAAPNVESEALPGEGLEDRLEARLAAIEATVRDLTGLVAADERLLAATIERLLGVQHSLMQMQRVLQEGQEQPDRQRRGRRGRGRPRRGDSDKR